jgi:hypothetical protein
MTNGTRSPRFRLLLGGFELTGPEARNPDLAARCRRGAESADCLRFGWKRTGKAGCAAKARLRSLVAGSLRAVCGQDMETPLVPAVEMASTGRDRPFQAPSVMSFIVAGEITSVGMSLPSGFETLGLRSRMPRTRCAWAAHLSAEHVLSQALVVPRRP